MLMWARIRIADDTIVIVQDSRVPFSAESEAESSSLNASDP